MDYKNESLNLMYGDCLQRLKELPDQSVDMVITDPPYGINFVSNYRKVKYNKIENDLNLEWLDNFISEIYRLSKYNTAHYVFCSFHNIDIFKQNIEKYFKVKNILVWQKNNTSMGDLKGDFAPKVEFIFFLHKGRSLIRGKRDPNIFTFNRTGNKIHPTQKPVDLMEYLIKKFSDIENTVLDPFMGSGSTGIACQNLGRNFIGIEKDEGYYNIAKERLLNNCLQK